MAVAAWTLSVPGSGASAPDRPDSSAAAALVSLTGSAPWTPAQLSAAAPVAAPYSEPGLGLRGSTHLAALAGSSGGTNAPDLQVVVSLAFSNTSRLATVLRQLQDPGSPGYHHYLSADSFDAAFGAPASVYGSLVQFVSSYGAHDIATHPDRLSLEFSIAPAQADKLFRTTLGSYVSAAGLPYYAPATPPQLPAPLAPYVVDLEGLSNYSQYTNHLLPIAHGPVQQVAAELGAGLAPKGQGGQLPPPGTGANPFNTTVPGTNNPLGLRFDSPVHKNLSVQPTATCGTGTCGDFLPIPDLQVTYNVTGLYQRYGYPVNATVASVLWSDSACRSNGGACRSNGYTNYWCTQQGFGTSTFAWDFYMPDVTSTWNYTLPAGEPMPTAYSLAVAGPSYGYPSGSQGFSSSCDSRGAESENTLDVVALGSLLPGANIFQVFDGTGGTSAGIAATLSDILSPTTSAFSTLGGFDSAASIAKLQNVSVITNSWSGSAFSGSTLTTWVDDLKQAAARGITVVGSTGDSGSSITFPTDLGGNSYGVAGVSGTTASINLSTLLRGPAHYASGGGVNGGTAPYYGVGTGEIGWYMPAGTVRGFSTTMGGTEGVTSNFSLWRPTWANSSSDALGVANTIRAGNFRFEADLAAVANDTLLDLSQGPDAFNVTCAVVANCTAISRLNTGSSSGSSPTVGWTYFVGTSIADQVAGAEIAVVDHALYSAPGTVCEGYWASLGVCTGHATHQGWVGFAAPGFYAQGQLQFAGELTLPSFYDVRLYTDGGGNTSAYQAKTGYDLATGWGVLDAGNYSQNELTYSASFVESGLPSGTAWTVALTPTVGDAGCAVSGTACINTVSSTLRQSTISFNETYGAYRYTVTPIPGYAVAPVSGTVAIHGTAVTIPIAFTPYRYPVTFAESGLANGTSWSVTLGGTTHTSSTSLVTFSEPNGTFAYSVTPIAGETVAPSHGSVVVAAAPANVSLVFTLVTYTLRFAEIGLANGTSWSVVVGGARLSGSGSSLALPEPNGSFGFSVSPIPGFTSSPSTGTVSVNGTNLSVAVVFTRVLYSVTFTESGLAAGTSWSVALAGVPASTNASGVGFAEPNGSYAFTVGAVAGYTASPRTGTVAVAGSAVNVSVVFSRVTYSISFAESGLVAGTNWTVTLGGGSVSGSGGTLRFVEPNGSYAFSVVPVAGYTVSPSTGTAVVNGASVNLSVTFTAVTYAVTFSEAGLASATTWSVVLGGTTLTGNGSSLGSSETNGTYAYSVAPLAGYTVSPRTGFVTVAGSNVSVAVTFVRVLYTISFGETGLPAGTFWSVTVDGAGVGGTGASLVESEPNGSYAYRVGAVAGYTVDPASGTVTVQGANVSVAIAFSAVSYPVRFNESGLAPGASWSVTLAGSTVTTTASDLSFSEPNGSYAFAVGPVPGYTVGPPTGNVTVQGGAVAVAVVFTAVTYPVTFSESGLAAGTRWNVAVGGPAVSGTGTSIAFHLVNGTYAFVVGAVPGYTGLPANGSIAVVGGAVNVSIVFARVNYAVTFEESGLPNGTVWNVTLAGALGTASGPSVGFEEPNGSYAYEVGAVPGYRVSPSSGTVPVVGADVRVNVTYVPATFTVTFVESGLVAGTSWSVTLGSSLASSSGASISYAAPNGTYAYTVGTVAGYAAIPRNGSVVVAGVPAIVNVTFAAVPYAVTFGETGLAPGTSWTVTLGGAPRTSTSGTVGFSIPNGSYAFEVGAVAGYTVGPNAGTVVVDGGPVAINVTFTVVRFAVTFSESGLPSGTAWSVRLNGTNGSATSGSIGFSEPNGTYAYLVTPVVGFTVLPRNGSVTVAGAAASVLVTYAVVRYPVDFAESGLPLGTNWSVALNGSPGSSTGPTVAFSVPNGSYSYAVGSIAGYTVGPRSGVLAVAGSNVTISVAFQRVLYGVAFVESGLANGTSWNVSVNGTASVASGATVQFSEPNGSFGFVVEPVAGYTVSPRTGTVTVNGSSLSVPVTFSPVRYPVTVSETGLGNGTVWTASLGGANGSGSGTTITFLEPNGSYGFAVAPLPGYTVAPRNGTAVVSGSPAFIAVSFTLVVYSVTFTEQGLANGTPWSASLAGASRSSNTSTLEFAEPNGTYAFSVDAVAGYTVAPASGSVRVAGAPAAVGLTFTAVTYPVTFRVVGLPLGTFWSVTLDGVPAGSASSTLPFAEPNGSFAYEVTPIPGYTDNPASGNLVVAGGAVGQTVTFTLVTYPVQVLETGLPNGTSWSVNVSGAAVFGSTSNALTFQEPNGSYTYTAGSGDLRYAAGSGTFVVAATGANVVVVFALVVYRVTLTENGLPNGTPWSVTVFGQGSFSSSSSEIALDAANGSYSYTVGASDLRYAAPGGNWTVDGAPLGLTIAFALVTFAVTFTESGLPNGTGWSVDVASVGSFNGTNASLLAGLPNGTYPYTPASSDLRYNASASAFTVAGGAVYVVVAFALFTYPVQVTQTGLPPGVSWTVNVSGFGSFGATGTGTTLALPNGSYSYTPTGPPGFAPTPSGGSFVVAGAAVFVVVAFAEVEFPVSFSESGLPAGTLWFVNVSGLGSFGATGTTISFLAPNGTYGYGYSSVAGYTLAASSGSFVVAGGSPPPSTAAYTLVRYDVRFDASGLANGTEWTVTFNGSLESTNGSTLDVGAYPNGTYGYTVDPIAGYSSSPTSGTLRVSGADVALPVAFTVVTYFVSFDESGLANGSSWTVTLHGTSRASTGAFVGFSEPNGSYAYTVTPIAGYVVNPESGTVRVNGADIDVAVTFVLSGPGSYTVSFVESGLANGTLWSVTLDGTTESGTNGTLNFSAPSGGYPFGVGPEPGYLASPATGTAVVNGADLVVGVTFQIVENEITFRLAGGLPPGKAWRVVLNGTLERSTGATAVFDLPNGTYSYLITGPGGRTVAGLPAAANLSVSGPTELNFTLAKGPTHPITFTEKGLPHTGRIVERWCVNVAGWPLCSVRGSLLVTNLTPGTYAYEVLPMVGQTIGAKSNKHAIGLAGELTVPATKGVGVALRYTFPYTVTFNETGLPPDTPFSITVRGLTETSSNGSIVFAEPNGSYGYAISIVTGYLRTGAPRPFHVVGGDVSVTITYTPKPPRPALAFAPLAPSAPGPVPATPNAAPPITGTTVVLPLAFLASAVRRRGGARD